MVDPARLEKLKRVAPMIATAAHLQKILLSFEESDRADVLAMIQPLLNLKDA